MIVWPSNIYLKNIKYSKLAIIGIIVISLTLPVITYRYWLPEIAEYLIVQDKVDSADIIIVISGDGSRYRYAAKLFNEGYAKYVLFNYNKEDMFNIVGIRFNPEEMIRDFAISNGIPVERVFTDGRCTSTYEDVLYAKENIVKKQFKSAIIISENFHMRRVYLTFKKLFKGNNIKLIFVPVSMEMDGINPDEWWTRESDLIEVFNEYIKLGFYYFKYGI